MLDTFDPNKIYHEVIDAGNAWAETQAKASFLEETKKVMEARLTDQHIDSGLSATAAKAKALASEEYEIHIKGMVAAREAADKAKVRYQAVVELSQNRRTQSVTNREQMKAA